MGHLTIEERSQSSDAPFCNVVRVHTVGQSDGALISTALIGLAGV